MSDPNFEVKIVSSKDKHLAILGAAIWGAAVNFWLLEVIDRDYPGDSTPHKRHSYARNRLYNARTQAYLGESVNIFPDNVSRETSNNHYLSQLFEIHIAKIASSNLESALSWCNNILNAYITKGWYDYVLDYWFDSLAVPPNIIKIKKENGRIAHKFSGVIDGESFSISSINPEKCYVTYLEMYYFGESKNNVSGCD